MKIGNQEALALYSQKELKLTIKGTKQMLEIYTGKRVVDNCSLCESANKAYQQSVSAKRRKLEKIFKDMNLSGKCCYCSWYIMQNYHCSKRFKSVYISTVRENQNHYKRQANIRRKELPNWIAILEAELKRR